jgi:DNA primase
MTSNDLDFADIKNQARFEAVLANYGLETTGQAAERMTKCPFHDDRSPSCSLNLDKKVFHCFACGEKGTILDFVARMESCSITEAARLLAEWCNIAGSLSAVASESEVRIKRSAGNQPLKFALQLDPRHRYLAARGVSEGTVSRFGLGYCDPFMTTLAGSPPMPVGGPDQRRRPVSPATSSRGVSAKTWCCSISIALHQRTIWSLSRASGRCSGSTRSALPPSR